TIYQLERRLVRQVVTDEDVRAAGEWRLFEESRHRFRLGCAKRAQLHHHLAALQLELIADRGCDVSHCGDDNVFEPWRVSVMQSERETFVLHEQARVLPREMQHRAACGLERGGGGRRRTPVGAGCAAMLEAVQTGRGQRQRWK